MRVLIVGEGKSGTTALMRSVATSLGNPVELFEPRTMTEDDLEPESLVVKKLVLNWQSRENALVERFDKRLLITRDPRDRLISHLLYDAYNRAPELSLQRRERWLKALQKKVDNPTKHSLTWLMGAWFRVSGVDLLSHYVRASDRGIAFERRNGKLFHTVSYEDYVTGSFGAINDYLGFAIEQGVVEGAESRVVRSKASGAWREWFTDADVNVFRPMTHRWLTEINGDPNDWELSSSPVLDPTTTVEYVRDLFARVPEPSPEDRKKIRKAAKKEQKRAIKKAQRTSDSLTDAETRSEPR